MALVKCVECGNEISDQAMACPRCGRPYRGLVGSLEYKSKKTLFGLPLVHIVYGPALDPATGKLRVAKGIVAIGGVAFGGVAIGGCAVGVLALGGFSTGLLAIGGFALGLAAAFGGGAVSLGIAIGGIAIGSVAVGGLAFGFETFGAAAGR